MISRSSKDVEQHVPEDIAALIAPWCREQGVRLCVLFGSLARGQGRARSDADLAVWPRSHVSTPLRLGWLCDLETMIERDVSLVLVSPGLDPVLGFEIARDGVVIFEHQPHLWTRERARLWHAHNDSLPFRRAARERLRRFAEEVRHGA